MGDLVAVMQVGGILAQFGPPAEILASPASDFVARFVGADRGLKRLSLRRVADLELAAGDVESASRRGAAARDGDLATSCWSTTAAADRLADADDPGPAADRGMPSRCRRLQHPRR